MDDVVSQYDVQAQAFRTDVLAGLDQSPKSLPSRWLYDDRGSRLFEEITALPEYYPSRTETGILTTHVADLAAFCGQNITLIEYGAGAGIKTEILLNALEVPELYVPIDIAGDFLDHTVARFRQRFPDLLTRALIADFTTDFALPGWIPEQRRVAFFPGSTIGNFGPDEVESFLRRLRRQVGAHGRAIIGVDLRKDVQTLLRAYDDHLGVTAAFNLNLLTRINRELGGEFRPRLFRHEARWNAADAAVEMHLVSQAGHTVRVAGRCFTLVAGETIHTESSRKYEVTGFMDIARRNGWHTEQVWVDPRRYFAVFALQ